MISLDIFPLLVVHAAFFSAMWVLASVSKVFGSAKKKKPVYRLYFQAALLLASALGVGVVGFDVPELKAYALLLDVVGLALAVAITYYYWGWLPRELSREA